MPSTTSTKVLTSTGTSGVPPLPADFPSAIAVLCKSTDLVYIAAALNVLVLSADLHLYLKVRSSTTHNLLMFACSLEMRRRPMHLP